MPTWMNIAILLILGLLWAASATMAFISFVFLAGSTKKRITENFEPLVPRSIFIAYPGVAEDSAKKLAYSLQMDGFSVFTYDPFRPFNDPVNSITPEIEKSEFVIVLHPGKGDWVTAEERYASILGKPIIQRIPHKDRVTKISQFSRWYAQLTRGAIRTTSRKTALALAFSDGVAQEDHDRSVSPSWEQYQSERDFDLEMHHLVIRIYYPRMIKALIACLITSGILIPLGAWWFMLLTLILLLHIHLAKTG